MSEQDQKPVRVAISKRLRFEVFKRDRFECQYCGQTPPAVILHCDHIIPVSGRAFDDFAAGDSHD